VEMMKQEKPLTEVIMTQKYEKHDRAVKVLATLSYFVELGNAVSGEADDADEQDENDIDDVCAKLGVDDESKKSLDSLKEMFERFDVDRSQSIDKEELGPLLECMGQFKSADELDRLFNLMDADGSGDVDFEEFATVMLSSRKGRRHLTPDALAEKLYAIFDADQDGTINTDEMIVAFEALGHARSSGSGYTWDTEDVRAFLEEIDRDGSGEISKPEFIDFVKQYVGEQHC